VPLGASSLVVDPADTPRIKAGIKILRDAARMIVRSEAGTDLAIDVAARRPPGSGATATARARSRIGPDGLEL
jgi:hypothetical protein